MMDNECTKVYFWIEKEINQKVKTNKQNENNEKIENKEIENRC